MKNNGIDTQDTDSSKTDSDIFLAAHLERIRQKLLFTNESEGRQSDNEIYDLASEDELVDLDTENPFDDSAVSISFAGFADLDDSLDELEFWDDSKEAEPLIDLDDSNDSEALMGLDDSNDSEALMDLGDSNDSEPLMDLDDSNDSEPLMDLDDSNDSEALMDLGDSNDSEALMDLGDSNDSEAFMDLGDSKEADATTEKMLELEYLENFEISAEDDSESSSGDESREAVAVSLQTKKKTYKEIDLEDLITLELTSELPEQKEAPVEEETHHFSLSWFTIFYCIILISCVFVSFHYNKVLQASLKQYEKEQPEAYMDELMKAFSTSDSIQQYFCFPEIDFSIWDYPDKMKDDYFEYMADASITYSRSEDFQITLPKYDLFANGNLIGYVYLNATFRQTYLGHFTTYDYDCNHIEAIVDISPTDYIIKAPSTYSVYVNGVLLSPDLCPCDTEPIAEFSQYASIIKVPYYNIYRLENVMYKPTINVKSATTRDISYIDNGTEILVAYSNETLDFPTLLLNQTDILSIMEKWSNFISGDTGFDNGGFDTVSGYLLEDSFFYQAAENYPENETVPGIRNAHSLPDYAFCYQGISKYSPYTDDFFSCVVSFSKNIVMESGDCNILDETYKCYFTKVPDDSELGYSWKILNIETLKYELQ